MCKIDDRVRWKHPEPTSSEAELNGKVTVVDGLQVAVRFDDGSEEYCDMDDLEVIDAK